jgi:hypothetical protein
MTSVSFKGGAPKVATQAAAKAAPKASNFLSHLLGSAPKSQAPKADTFVKKAVQQAAKKH